MSNRRRRNSNANIPQETLERARRQAAGESSGDESEAAPARVEAPQPRARVSAAPAPRRSGQTLRKRKEDDKMSSEEVAERLANPTKEVTEAELRAHYTYVINDLRSMGLLAAGLMVALVILAQVLPR